MIGLKLITFVLQRAELLKLEQIKHNVMNKGTTNIARRVFLVVLFTISMFSTAWCQSKFHFDVDYHYMLGLSEHIDGFPTLNRSDRKMGGHSLHLTPRYDVSRLWSVGLGIGLDRYTNSDYNTLPIFATVRYKAIKKVPDFYTFADLGYAISSFGGDFTNGITGSLGLGYTYMFAKHFGLNFQLAYNAKQFLDVPTYVIDIPSGDVTYSERNSVRHSLSFGIGMTF